MTVVKRSILEGSGDARDIASADPATSGALGDETAHGDVSSHAATQSRATGEQPGGSAGFGLGGDTDTGFSATGYNDSDEPGQQFGKSEPGNLVIGDYSTQGQSGDSGSDTSGYGKVI